MRLHPGPRGAALLPRGPRLLVAVAQRPADQRTGGRRPGLVQLPPLAARVRDVAGDARLRQRAHQGRPQQLQVAAGTHQGLGRELRREESLPHLLLSAQLQRRDDGHRQTGGGSHRARQTQPGLRPGTRVFRKGYRWKASYGIGEFYF